MVEIKVDSRRIRSSFVIGVMRIASFDCKYKYLSGAVQFEGTVLKKEISVEPFEDCCGTYVKVVRFTEPPNPDGFIVLYLRPGGRFLFIGYWLGYENSVAAGYWTKRESEYHLQGYGRVRSDAPPCHHGRFVRTLKLETVRHTPILTAAEELKEWSLLSWVGPFTYIGEHTVIPNTKELPDSLAVVDQWIDEIVERTHEGT
jgi:hypothetical protein